MSRDKGLASGNIEGMLGGGAIPGRRTVAMIDKDPYQLIVADQELLRSFTTRGRIFYARSVRPQCAKCLFRLGSFDCSTSPLRLKSKSRTKSSCSKHSACNIRSLALNTKLDRHEASRSLVPHSMIGARDNWSLPLTR